MPVTEQFKYGDYVFEANNVDSFEWSESRPTRSGLTLVPRSDTARTKDGVLGTKMVTIEGAVARMTSPSLDNQRVDEDALMAAMKPGYRALYKESDRYLLAEVEEITTARKAGDYLTLPISLRFRCASPYYYATAGDTASWVIYEETGAPMMSVLAGGSVPVGTYEAVIVYSDANGNSSSAGGAGSVTTTTTERTLRATRSCPAFNVYTTWDLYVGVPGGPYYKQNGSPIPIATTTYDVTTLVTTGTTSGTGLKKTVNNGGNAPTFAAYTFKSSVTGTLTFTLTNSTTGKSFTFSATVADDDLIVWDTDAKTLTVNGVNALSSMTGGSFFALEPGGNAFTLTQTAGTVENISIAFTKRYY